MKFNFNKKMVSTIVILIFGVAITVAALSAKNIALENKTSSEIATEAVSATEMILDTENTETSNVDKNSDESSTTTKETGKSLKDTKSSSENTDNNDSRNSYETDIMKNDESENTSDDVNKTAAISLPKLVTSLIPTNIFLDLTGARSVSVIGIVIFTLLAGVALLKVKQDAPQEGEKLSAGINAIQIWVMKMVRIVIALTPYGVMALMAGVFSAYRFEQFASLLGFIAACYLAILMMFIVHALILVLSGNNPVHYFKTVWPVLTFAFVSRSSAASIPLAISAQEKFGVQNTIANIAASFGSSMGQNGCAGIYPAIMVAMIAPTIGIDPLSVHFLLAMLPAIALGSIGVAGVGGGGTFAALIVLSTLNFPVALVGIFIAIEPVVDMARTALNVNGSMMSGVLANRLLKKSAEKPQPVNAN